MSEYQPWVGKLDDGTEILVQLFVDILDGVESVQVAFRSERHHAWGPPTTCVAAP